MVCERKLLWNRVLLGRKVAGTSHASDLVVIVVIRGFIISLYDFDSTLLINPSCCFAVMGFLWIRLVNFISD